MISDIFLPFNQRLNHLSFLGHLGMCQIAATLLIEGTVICPLTYNCMQIDAGYMCFAILN